MLLDQLIKSTEWCDREIFLQPGKDAEYIEISERFQELLKEVSIISPNKSVRDSLSDKLENECNGLQGRAMEVCYKKGFQDGVKHIIACLYSNNTNDLEGGISI